MPCLNWLSIRAARYGTDTSGVNWWCGGERQLLMFLWCRHVNQHVRKFGTCVQSRSWILIRPLHFLAAASAPEDVVYKSVLYLPLWLCTCGTITCTPNEAVEKQWGQRGDRLSLSHVVLQHGYWQLKHWKLSECLHRMVQLSSGSLVDLPSSRSCDPWNTDCVWFFSNAVKLQISYLWIMLITCEWWWIILTAHEYW